MWRDDPVGTAFTLLEEWFVVAVRRLAEERLVERGSRGVDEVLAPIPSQLPTGLPAGYPQTVPTAAVALAGLLLSVLLAYATAYIIQGRSVRADGYALARWLLAPVRGAKRAGPRGVGWALLWPIRKLVWVLTWPLRMALRGVWWLTVGTLRSLLRRTGTDSYTARVAVAVMAVSGLVIGVAAFAFATADIEIASSSAPVLIGFFDLITNPWAYVLAALVMLRVQLFMLDRVLAYRTSVETGFSYRTVRLLAEEAKKPDLETCTRVLAQTGDTAADIEGWLQRALATGEGHDVPTLEEGAADDHDQDVEPEVDTRFDVAPDDEQRQEDLPLSAQFALARNDIAAAFDTETFLWRFGGPFIATFAIELLLARIWVVWWLYPVLLAVAAFVGATYYFATDYRYRRRLRALREEPDVRRRSDCSLLVKTVETPETTMYYLFAAGNRYASPDRDRLARVGAAIAMDVLEGRRPRPAVEQRYARLLTQYIPNLESWMEQREKPDIVDRLVNAVSDAPEGILPQNVLIEHVVEHDRGYAFRGLVPVGMGHDPDLVREVYADLVDVHALVEDPVTVSTADGETEVAAVSRGDKQLAPHVLKVRSEFSTWFQRHRETRYDVEPVAPDPNVRPFRPPDGHGERAEQPAAAGGD